MKYTTSLTGGINAPDGRNLAIHFEVLSELNRLLRQRDALLGACKKALHDAEYDENDSPCPCSCHTCETLRNAIKECEP